MNLLLILALIWLPIALVLDVTVRTQPLVFGSFAKKALFYVVTLPLVWLRVLERGVSRVSSLSFLAKIAKWFRS